MDGTVGLAIRILDVHRVMAVSTVRPDGWPQVTFVGYANIGLLLSFMVFGSSQKLGNIRHDDRIAIAVGGEPHELSQAQAVYSSAHAVEVTDASEREQAWRLLAQRHPNLLHHDMPDAADAVLMRSQCEHVAVVDYTRGLGHVERFTASSIGLEPDGRPDRSA